MKNIQTKATRKLGTLFAGMLVSIIVSQPIQAFDYPEQGDIALGAQQWAENCTRCHNLRGPNELRDDQWITSMFHMRLRAGLTGEETRNILAFIQASNNSLVGQSTIESSTAHSEDQGIKSGKTIYDQTCIACHGSSGKGAIPGVPDLTDKLGRLSRSDDVLFSNVIRGLKSPGSTMAMPPKGGNPNLSDVDIRSVIEYMHSSFGP